MRLEDILIAIRDRQEAMQEAVFHKFKFYLKVSDSRVISFNILLVDNIFHNK